MPSKLVALWCWYHGSAFRGYQSQPVGPTVQDSLTAALRAAGFLRNPVPAGRTDLGVHARMQVLSLRIAEDVRCEELGPILLPHLPPHLGIACCVPAPPKFNAAWSSSGKEYRYRILLGDERDAPDWANVCWRVNVDPQRLAQVLESAVGTRDFFAFHDKSSAVKLRTLHQVSVSQGSAGRLEVRFRGTGFARYMVRFLMGAAVDVAQGKHSLETYLQGLEKRVPFGPTKAPAQGLVLWEVDYPAALDPFGAKQRQMASGVPLTPPFICAV